MLLQALARCWALHMVVDITLFVFFDSRFQIYKETIFLFIFAIFYIFSLTQRCKNFWLYFNNFEKSNSCAKFFFCRSHWNELCVNSLSANPTKWSNTLKQFLGKLPTNCLSVFDHFVKLALKGLNWYVNFYIWLCFYFYLLYTFL